MRRATISRKTAETEITVTVTLDGTGVYDNRTGWDSLTTCWTSCRGIR